MPKEWFCVNTNPRQEHLAVMHLGNRGFTTMFPQFTHPRTHNQHPLFPGYLFVNFDVDRTNWKLIFSTPGVKQLFLRTQGVPLPIPQQIIDRIEQQALDSQWLATEEPCVQIGDKVKIVAGSFEGFEGVCCMTSAKRIEVLVAILGRTTEIGFLPTSVERVAS